MHKKLRTIAFLNCLMCFAACNHKQHKNLDEYVDLIYAQAHHNYESRLDSMAIFYTRVDTLNTELLNSSSKSRVHYIKGLHFRTILDYSAAKNHFIKAQAEVDKNTAYFAELLKNELICNSKLGNDSLYYAQIEELEQLTEALNKDILFVKLLSVKGSKAIQQSNYRLALEYFLRVKQYLKNEEYPYDDAITHYKLAVIYKKLKNKDKAFFHYNKAISIAKEHKLDDTLYRTYNSLANFYRKEKRFDESYVLLKTYFDYYCNKDQFVKMATAQDNFGKFYGDKRQWDKSIYHFNEALKLKTQSGDSASIALAFTNLALSYRRMGYSEKATELLKKALQIRQRNNLNGSSTYLNKKYLAQQYLDHGKTEEATAIYNDLLNPENPSGYDRYKSLANLKLAEIHSQNKQFELSSKFYKNHVVIQNKLDMDEQERELNEQIALNNLYQADLYKTFELKEERFRQTELFYLALFSIVLIAMVLIGRKLHNKKLQRLETQLTQKIEDNNPIQELCDSQVKEYTTKTNNETFYFHEFQKLMDQQIYTNPNISLESVSKTLNTNTSYLSKIINNEYQLNFKNVIGKYRIEYCKDIILNDHGKELSFKCLALEAGFQYPSTFYAAFKKETGLTPAKYRDEHVTEAKIKA